MYFLNCVSFFIGTVKSAASPKNTADIPPVTIMSRKKTVTAHRKIFMIFCNFHPPGKNSVIFTGQLLQKAEVLIAVPYEKIIPQKPRFFNLKSILFTILLSLR